MQELSMARYELRNKNSHFPSVTILMYPITYHHHAEKQRARSRDPAFGMRQ
jgi:hypothetical protein